MTLLCLVGRLLYSRIVSNHFLKCLELNDKLHEGQGGLGWVDLVLIIFFRR